MRTVRVSLEITYDETIHDHPEAWNWADLLGMDTEPDTLYDERMEWFRLVAPLISARE